MKLNRASRPLLALSLILCVALSACFQLEQTTTVYGDGSGKMQLAFAVRRDLVDRAREAGEEHPLAQILDPLRLDENSEGVEAWTPPVESMVDDWVRVSTTAYFPKIDKVKVFHESSGADGKTTREVALSFERGREDGVHVITVQNELMTAYSKQLGIGADASDDTQFDRDRWAAKLKGMTVQVSMTVPGEVEIMEGFSSRRGRTATLKANDRLALDAAGTDESEGTQRKRRLVLGAQKARIGWRHDLVHFSRLEKFREEMREAQDQWEALLKRLGKK